MSIWAISVDNGGQPPTAEQGERASQAFRKGEALGLPPYPGERLDAYEARLQAALAERARITAWLRDVAVREPDHLCSERVEGGYEWNTSIDVLDAGKVADAIERGEHLGKRP